MSEQNKLKERDLKIKQWALSHPFVIILGVIVIAYAGYRFGVWFHGAIN
jgi:hypothetical protein